MTLQQLLPLATQALAYALPFCGLVLPGFLKKDSLSPVANAVIVGIVTIIVSALQSFCAGNLGLILLLTSCGCGWYPDIIKRDIQATRSIHPVQHRQWGERGLDAQRDAKTG